MKQFLPANLDIDALIMQMPPNTICNFSKDKLIHLLHLIYSVPANNKDLEITAGFVPLHSQILKRRIPNYKQYLIYLEGAGILESDGYYIKGSKSRGYRYAQKYEETSLRQVDITNRALVQHQKSESRLSSALLKSHGHLTKWLDKGLQINYDMAMDFIHARRKKLNAAHIFETIDTYDDALHSIHRQFTSSYINIERIRSSDFFISVDSNVFRFHSNITNLHSALRHCLHYKGEHLVSVDIANSQPYISTLLLNADFWNNSASDGFTIRDLDNKKLYNTLTTASYTSIIMYPKKAVNCNDSDFEEYVKIVTEGRLYEYFEDMMKRELGESFATRKEIKAAMFQVMFTANQFIAQKEAAPKRLFKQAFPHVYDVFAALKKKDKTKLPRLLQNIESKLILKTIAKRVAKERPMLPIFTIHDSIATTAGNETYIKNVMEEELFKAVGYKPILAIQSWEPSLLTEEDSI